MKRTMLLGIAGLGLCAIVIGLLLRSSTTGTGQVAAAASPPPRIELNDLIPGGRPASFVRPILAVGDQLPTEEDSTALAQALQVWPVAGEQAGTEALEAFLQAFPQSAWGPAVRAQLGKYYRETGRWTSALQHWEAAYDATWNRAEPPAKEVCDFVLAHWTRLLASLGRIEALEVIFKENSDRVLDQGPLSQMWSRTREAYAMMQVRPEIAYRCGTFAMANVGRVLYADQVNPRSLWRESSPLGGFTLAALTDFSLKHNLNLVAVHRGESLDLVVPSVVHWAQDHYAAIVEQVGDLYKVVDPTFGEPVWLEAEAINAEASGYLLVHAQQVPAGWRVVAAQEAQQVIGRGYYNTLSDDDNQPCETCPCPPPDQSKQDKKDKEDGNREGDQDSKPDPGCADCQFIEASSGMVSWSVSEPYINLWLTDQPMSYQPSRGPKVECKLRHKQRDENAGGIPNATSFGKGVNCSWLSYVQVSASQLVSYGTGPAYVFLSGGGKSSFQFQSGVNPTATDYFNQARLKHTIVGSQVTKLELLRPDGSKLVFGLHRYVSGQSPPDEYFLTQIVDPYGRAVILEYPNFDPNVGVVRLEQIWDVDNRVTTLSYVTSGSNPNMVGTVTDPFNRTVTFQYDGNELLTNVIDVVGIASGLTYDGNGWPASVTTPYGTTAFSHYAAYDPDTGAVIGRTVTITEPGGGQQRYTLDPHRDPANPYPPAAYPASEVPQNTPLNTFDNVENHQRNSFYWNRQQFPLLTEPFKSSSVPLDMSTNAMKVARLRHWLQSEEPWAIDTLALERSPSPDGTTDGQKTWYDYEGKDSQYPQYRGSGILPVVIARVLPGVTNTQPWYVRYQRNFLGQVTNIVETYTTAAGAWSTRSRRLEWSSDGLDLLWEKDFSGNTVREYTYNSAHQVLTATEHPASGVNYTTTYTYDAQSRVATLTTPGSLLSTYTYGTDAFLQKVVDSISGTPLRTNAYTWLNAQMRTHTDPRNLTRTFTHDGLDRLTEVLFPDSTTQQHRYTNGVGTMLLDRTASKDRLNKWTYTLYNGLRQVRTVTDPLSRVTSFGYCDCGALSSLTNALGQVTRYTYDYAGRRTSVTFADNTYVNFAFNSLGQLTNQSDTLGARSLAYNNQGLLTNTSTAFGTVQRLVYDLEDNAGTVIDANGVTLNQGFDWIGRVLTRTNAADSGKEYFGYSALGLTKYTNQLNLVTSYGYDNAGRKIRETNANPEVLEFSYSPADDLKTLKDGKGQTTTWNYDLYGRVTNKLDQASVEILRYTYDANSRLATRWSKAKGTTSYAYDSVGSLTNVNYPVSTDLTFQYDALNRATNMVDAAGTTKFTYDNAGNLATEDGPWSSDTVTYAYHSTVPGLRTSLTAQQPSSSWSQTYGYDAAKRLQSVGGTSGSFTYAYKGPGTVWTNLALPNTAAITNGYDGAARLTGTYLKNSGGTILNKHLYSYNPAHQRTQQTFPDLTTANYTYDNIGQLKVADSSVAAEDRGYLYDAAWNLNQRTNNGVVTTFGVDVKNQLTTVGGLSCTYDANGNLTSRVYDSNGPKTYTYGYDDENQLTSAATDTYYTPAMYRWKTEFVYDGRLRLRKRIEYTWNTGYGAWQVAYEIRYVYDGMRVIQDRDSGNTPTVAYTRGVDLSGSLEGAGGIGGLLARSHGYSGGSWSTHNFYHADGGGNVTYLVSSGQAMQASYKYDPYGNTVSSSGSLASTNVFRFSSKAHTGNSGLYYYGYRFYDPNLQRWLNRDPLADRGSLVVLRPTVAYSADQNLYRFVANDPVVLVDPDGLTDRWYAPGSVDNDCDQPLPIVDDDLGLCTFVSPKAKSPPARKFLPTDWDFVQLPDGRWWKIGIGELDIGQNGLPKSWQAGHRQATPKEASKCEDRLRDHYEKLDRFRRTA